LKIQKIFKMSINY